MRIISLNFDLCVLLSNRDIVNKMATEGHEEGRCGPLCQHPGCWYSSERDRLKLLKCQGYFHYLAGLLLKRESKSSHKEPDDNGEVD